MTGRILRQSEVTPEMSNWALTLLGNPLGTEFHRFFGDVDITARVEIHTNGTSTNPLPHPHPGVTLYHTDGAPAFVDTHPTLPEGIDLHASQWPVQWSQVVASGRSFVYIKASEGITYTDGRLHDHFGGAGAVGLKRGPYHYFLARDGAEQIDHFLSCIDGYEWELPPVLDVEEADHQALAVVVDRLAECLDASPTNVGIYTMPGFWNTLPASTIDAWLWVATWGPKPLGCIGLGPPKIWQYSASAIVPGYPGHADVNRMLDPGFFE
jgi:lysozyme